MLHGDVIPQVIVHLIVNSVFVVLQVTSMFWWIVRFNFCNSGFFFNLEMYFFLNSNDLVEVYRIKL